MLLNQRSFRSFFVSSESVAPNVAPLEEKALESVQWLISFGDIKEY